MGVCGEPFLFPVSATTTNEATGGLSQDHWSNGRPLRLPGVVVVSTSVWRPPARLRPGPASTPVPGGACRALWGSWLRSPPVQRRRLSSRWVWPPLGKEARANGRRSEGPAWGRCKTAWRPPAASRAGLWLPRFLRKCTSPKMANFRQTGDCISLETRWSVRGDDLTGGRRMEVCTDC